jgi:hypothetical protein
VDYTLRVAVGPAAQPVAVALIEAKAEDLPPTHGLEQAKAYAACKRLNVPFVFASNGHRFVEFDRSTGRTGPVRLLAEFPAPAELRARYEKTVGFSLDDAAARPLVTRYSGGEEGTRRYYQDAAVRAVLEKLARGNKRALLSRPREPARRASPSISSSASPTPASSGGPSSCATGTSCGARRSERSRTSSEPTRRPSRAATRRRTRAS